MSLLNCPDCGKIIYAHHCDGVNVSALKRIKRCAHRAIESFHGCEKCGKLTNWQVKVVDRWATWCGCGNSVLVRTENVCAAPGIPNLDL